jgi:Sulfotransferase domain
MTIRAAMPHPVKTAGRAVSVRVGSATASRRQLPSVILVGAQRAGTTSFFRALMSHPLIHSANYHKGVNYFDVNYHRDFSWYQGHFPTAASLQKRSRDVAGEPISFEASGYYMFHPCAAERMARHLPDVRILAMLRDPVERAYSAYKHELARGFETETFERALELEDDRLEGQAERMLADPAYQSFSHRHHAYLRRGQYAEQLQRLREHFPAEQIHVVDSESFFEQPETTYAGVLDFLEMPHVMPGRFDRWNGRPSSPMSAETRTRLREHFAGHDRVLAELIGREPAWLT